MADSPEPVAVGGALNPEQLVELEDIFFDGSDLVGEGKFQEALACFDRCLAIDPNYGDALLGKAMVAMNEERFDDAIVLAKRLVELNPEDILAYTNLSVFCQRADRIEEAEEAGAKARMLDWKQQIQGVVGETPDDTKP